jgi:N-acetylmuramic acid 6-phosphate etherase
MGLHALPAAGCIDLILNEDRAVLTALDEARGAISAFVQAVEPRFTHPQSAGRLIYLGAGTSGRLGVLDASEAPPTFCVGTDRIIGIIAGGDGALRKSSEGMEDDPRGAMGELRLLGLSDRDAVLAVAAGGTTPYAVGGLEVAKHLAPGCLTGLLTCSPVPKPPHCDHLIVLNTGPEVLTGSTRMKAGSATKMALNTISTTLMVRSGRVYQNLMVDLRATNAKLRDRAARVISTLTGLDRAAALAMLDRAGGRAKLAIAMHALNLDAEAAQLKLDTVRGRLGDLLDRR